MLGGNRGSGGHSRANQLEDVMADQPGGAQDQWDLMMEQSSRLEELEVLYADLQTDLDQAETKAWDSLSRYKFQMFGYWAGIWVHLNRIGGFKRPNPWVNIVRASRVHQQGQEQQSEEDTHEAV